MFIAVPLDLLFKHANCDHKHAWTKLVIRLWLPWKLL